MIEPTWYEKLTAIVSAVNAVLLLGLLTALSVAAWSLWKTFRNVKASIDSANGVFQRALGKTETRLNEFNALLQVAQEEAERAFVSTASLVRGVKEGASALGKSASATANGAREATGESDHGDDNESDADPNKRVPSEQPSERASRPRLKPRGRTGRRS